MMAFLHSYRRLMVFLAVFLVHAGSKNMTSYDSRWSIPVALSILHHRNIHLDEYSERIQADRYYGIQRVDGHLYNLFPIGTSILALPFVWMIDSLLDATTGISLEEHLQANPSHEAERFIASIFVALAAVFMLGIAEKRLAPGIGPVCIAFAFAFGTSAWSTASRALWQHGPSMLLLTASLFVLITAGEHRRRLLWLGPLLAFAYVVRPTNSLSFALLMGVAFFKHKSDRFFWGSVLLALAVFGAFAALNLRVYGNLLPPYYQAGRLSFGPTFTEALAGNLVSPSRGLFVYTPVCLLSFYGMFLKVRQRTFQGLDAALLAILFLHWIVISSFPHWWGGHSVGPRFFTEMTPFFVFFLIPVVAEASGSRGLRRVLVSSVFTGLLMVSVYIHHRSAHNWRVLAWNVTPECVDRNPARVWDWSDPQFRRRSEKPPR